MSSSSAPFPIKISIDEQVQFLGDDESLGEDKSKTYVTVDENLMYTQESIEKLCAACTMLLRKIRIFGVLVESIPLSFFVTFKERDSQLMGCFNLVTFRKMSVLENYATRIDTGTGIIDFWVGVAKELCVDSKMTVEDMIEDIVTNTELINVRTKKASHYYSLRLLIQFMNYHTYNYDQQDIIERIRKSKLISKFVEHYKADVYTKVFARIIAKNPIGIIHVSSNSTSTYPLELGISDVTMYEFAGNLDSNTARGMVDKEPKIVRTVRTNSNRDPVLDVAAKLLLGCAYFMWEEIFSSLGVNSTSRPGVKEKTMRKPKGSKRNKELAVGYYKTITQLEAMYLYWLVAVVDQVRPEDHAKGIIEADSESFKKVALHEFFFGPYARGRACAERFVGDTLAMTSQAPILPRIEQVLID